MKSFTFGNGLVFTKTLTQDYLIDTLKAQDTGTSTTVVDRGHAFGDDVNLTGITDNVTPARTETYAYTPANRLQTAGGIWGSLAYGYDSVGNRTSEALTSGGTTIWTYAYPPTNNKLSTVTEGANVRTLTHDGAGNISADDRVGTVYNYRYNNRGRLDRLTIGSALTADYVYDGLERLAIRTTQNMTPAGTTHYVYDLQGHLIAEANDTGQNLREYVWLDEMPLALVADVDTISPQLWFVHADHLDRPVRMTDGTQAVLWDAVYRPFGGAVSITGSASNNLRFPGQYFLMESGLHHNWHRQYDPTTGRYLQPDLLGFVDGPSLYAYALNSPLVFVDPRGEFVWVPFIAAGLTAAFCRTPPTRQVWVKPRHPPPRLILTSRVRVLALELHHSEERVVPLRNSDTTHYSSRVHCSTRIATFGLVKVELLVDARRFVLRAQSSSDLLVSRIGTL